MYHMVLLSLMFLILNIDFYNLCTVIQCILLQKLKKKNVILHALVFENNLNSSNYFRVIYS